MNIVIGKVMYAWIIDFDGSNNVEFVDDIHCETVEGDKQGIRRLFQEWLFSRFKRCKEISTYRRLQPS
jgi:hypothetical protein